MSKVLSGIAVALLVSWTNITVAQTPSPLLSPSLSPSPPPSTPTPAATAPDLELLAKAVSAFWQTNRTQTESQVVMTLRDKGKELKVNFNVKIIAETGNKFRLELALIQPNGSPNVTYTIVSNGKQAWVYNQNKRQYAQTTYDKLQEDSSPFFVGSSSMLFMSIPETLRKEVMAELASNPNSLAASISKDDLKSVQGGKRQVDGQDLYVFSYMEKVKGWNITGFFQPQTGIVRQVEFAGKVDSTEFVISEKIINRNSQPVVNSSTFKFTPPKGVKKVKALSINLFGSV